MKRAVVFRLVLVCAGCCTETRVYAEELELYEPAGRQGYFLGGGLRSGVMSTHSDVVGSLGVMQGGGLVLRGGQMATDWIGFGLVLMSGGGASKEWSGGYGGLLMDFQFVPMPEYRDLALHAGIGFGFLAITRTEEVQRREDDPEGTAGSLYTLGVSYDWFPFWEPGDTSGGFGVTIFVEGQLLFGGSLVAGGIFMGIEAMYWTGLSDNKLKLGADEGF